MGRKLGSAELNRLARTKVEAAVAGSRTVFPDQAVGHVKQNLCKKIQIAHRSYKRPAGGAGKHRAGQLYELAEQQLARGHFSEAIILCFKKKIIPLIQKTDTFPSVYLHHIKPN